MRKNHLYDDPEIIITPEGKNIVLTPIDIEALRVANDDSMFLIEHEAMEFINSIYRRYKGITKASETNPDIDFQALAARLEKKTGEKQVVVKESCDSFDIMPESEANAQGKGAVLTSKIDQFVVSFSGGKDSQVLLDLVARVVPTRIFLSFIPTRGMNSPRHLSSTKRLKNTTQNDTRNWPSMLPGTSSPLCIIGTTSALQAASTVGAVA